MTSELDVIFYRPMCVKSNNDHRLNIYCSMFTHGIETNGVIEHYFTSWCWFKRLETGEGIACCSLDCRLGFRLVLVTKVIMSLYALTSHIDAIYISYNPIHVLLYCCLSLISSYVSHSVLSRLFWCVLSEIS